MASVTLCDHCGKMIDKGQGHVTIAISDVWSTDMLKSKMLSGQQRVPLDRNWDLHRECYTGTVQGFLEAGIGAPP